MFRYDQRSIRRSFLAYAFLILCFSAGFFMLRGADQMVSRLPASDDSKASLQKATLSVSINEFQDSKPAIGRSFFDKIFSENGVYQIPYPFTKVLSRLSEYTGQKINNPDGTGLKVIIIPMGRSLQRNAALDDGKLNSIDQFFRYPRVVVGVDEETNHENSLLLNLKNKLYLGFNEKAQVIEAISYNDDLGRYEYQVVNNYAEGKFFQVSYANRSLCLSCHQNQTPIFSRGPWSETNANPVMAEKLQAVLDQAFGKASCMSSSSGKTQPYCYQDRTPFYFGAPIHIESNVTRQLDTSTDLANLTHAYGKMWKEFCTSESCRLAHLQSALLYRLTGQEGIRPDEDVKAEVSKMEKTWQMRYPWGLGIPSPDILDRDPFKDVESDPKISDLSTVSQASRRQVLELLAFSKIPAAFEPLMPRAPIGVWKDTEIDGAGSNRLIRGLAQEFTQSDIKLIDQWLKANRNDKDVLVNLTSLCEIKKEKTILNFNCKGDTEESFSFAASIDLNRSQASFTIAEVNYKSKTLGCLAQGDFFCPKFFDVQGTYSKINESRAQMVLQFKNGFRLKNSEAYDMSEIEIDLDAKIAQLKIYDPVPLLSSLLKKSVKDLFPNHVFNRFQIMKVLLGAGSTKLTRVQNEDYQRLPLSVEANFAAEELEQNMNGFALMKNVCAQCHQSNSSSPPHFMGTLTQPLNDFEMCQQIEQCAPRMIYRLKMRECADGGVRKKKAAMPPGHFFADEASIHQWMNIYNPKIIKFLSSLIDEETLTKNLLDKGMAENQIRTVVQDLLVADCPESESAIYDQFPKCELNKIKPFTTKTRCH
jgi:hypothetical protein